MTKKLTDWKKFHCNRLEYLLLQGPTSSEELCRRTGLKPTTMGLYLCWLGKEFIDKVLPHKTEPAIDCLIEEGWPMAKIADKVGKSVDLIRKYIIGSGQYNIYRKRRKEKGKAHRFSLDYKLVSTLKRITLQQAKRQSWVEGKAYEYVLTRKVSDAIGDRLIPLHKIILMLQDYEYAQSKGKRLSLQKLSKKLDSFPSTVGSILSKMGLDPMHGKRERITPSTSKKQAAARVFNTKLSVHDIGFFLEIPFWVVRNVMQALGQRPRTCITKFAFRGPILTYKLSSQIYEARDIGFNNDEIVELLDTHNYVVDYTFKHEQGIAADIRSALQLLYQKERVEKPYLDRLTLVK